MDEHSNVFHRHIDIFLLKQLQIKLNFTVSEVLTITLSLILKRFPTKHVSIYHFFVLMKAFEHV